MTAVSLDSGRGDALARPKVRLALAALAGIGTALGQAPFHLAPLALLALGMAGWLCRSAPDARRAAWIGFAAGTGYFAVTLHWIVEPFLVDVARHGWMAPFALVFSATGFALFWALAFWVARRLAVGGWRFALAFGAALAGGEALRSLILTGFPWVLIGYIWSEGPVAQAAAFVGPFGLTLATTLVAGLLASIGPRPLAVLMGAAIWGGAVLTFGMRPAAPAPQPDAPVLRLVQPNAPQHLKWDPEYTQMFFERALDLTAAPGSPDLVLWPETSVPYLIEPGHPVLDILAQAAGGVPLAVGGQRAEGSHYFNSLISITADGEIRDIYDKHHLVPFGEYVPFGDLVGRVGIRGLAQGEFGYSPGPGQRLVDLGPLGQVLPLICYEAIFPEEVGAVEPRADWMLQITNDAWFGTFAGPQQHLAITRMRAIEQGLPLVRVANTGISAVITATGQITAELGLGEAGYLDAALPPALAPTPYARIGDWPAFVLILLLLSGTFALRVKSP
ncbi:apolipoprotein N-acyltransferase [Palleronia sp.]|uniref:apolipoprotein N-acyltransferase n=1 Tax=Palleronia sp. TaxID=1940284 RepID=UPI0035C83850